MRIKMSDQANQSSNRNEVLFWFLNFTSIGGLSQSYSANQKLSKVVWAVVFICGSIFTVWNFAGVLQDYWANRVKSWIHLSTGYEQGAQDGGQNWDKIQHRENNSKLVMTLFQQLGLNCLAPRLCI